MERAVAWHQAIRIAPAEGESHDALDAWIAEDPAHARAWALVHRAWALAGDVPPVFIRGDVAAAKSGGAAASVIPFARRRPARRIGFAAAAAIAACLLLFAAPGFWTDLFQADHATQAGEMRDLALEDGSTVTLGADSAIALAFAPDRRGVTLLRGEAFFHVMPDKVRPFRVEAAELTVTVTGTAFDVRIADRSLSVAVESGSVRVARRGAADAAPASLSPGQRLAYDRATGAFALSDIPGDAVATWRSGRLVVENVALADVVDTIARHHRGAIVIASPSLGDRRVTGVYDLDNPARSLRALVGPYGGVVRELTPYLIAVSAF